MRRDIEKRGNNYNCYITAVGMFSISVSLSFILWVRQMRDLLLVMFRSETESQAVASNGTG